METTGLGLLALSDDVAEYLWWIGAAPVVLFLLLLVAILASLPKNPQTEELTDGDVDDEVRGIVQAFEALGFSRCGAPIRIALSPAATVVPLIHPAARCYATVYRIAAPRAPMYDVVSLLQLEQSGLTTGMTHEAGVAPAWLGSLRQIFVGASPAELFTAHKEGLAHIERAGLAVREVAPEELMPGLLQSFRLQRSVFTRAPVRNVFRALVRTLTRRNPHLGPLADQAIAETQLRALRDGLWPPR